MTPAARLGRLSGNGRYLLPLQAAVREPAGVEVEQVVVLGLRVGR